MEALGWSFPQQVQAHTRRRELVQQRTGQADHVRPMQARSIDLGEVSGVAYYTVERSGLTKTLWRAAQRRGGQLRALLASWPTPCRFSGQSRYSRWPARRMFSVPGAESALLRTPQRDVAVTTLAAEDGDVAETRLSEAMRSSST